jgi:hypothetical protein
MLPPGIPPIESRRKTALRSANRSADGVPPEVAAAQ